MILFARANCCDESRPTARSFIMSEGLKAFLALFRVTGSYRTDNFAVYL